LKQKAWLLLLILTGSLFLFAGCSKTLALDSSSSVSNPDLIAVLREKGCLENIYREVDLDFDGVSEIIAYPVDIGTTFRINPSIFTIKQDGTVQTLYQGSVFLPEEQYAEKQYEFEGVTDIYLLTDKATQKKVYAIEWYFADGFCTEMRTLSTLSRTADKIIVERLFYEGCDGEAESVKAEKYGDDYDKVHTLMYLIGDRKTDEEEFRKSVKDFWEKYDIQQILSEDDFEN